MRDTVQETPLLRGAPAFRDLGGIRSMDGRSIVRGRVFRSCGLMELTAEDVSVIRDSIGLRAVIDLRHSSEVANDGHGPLDGLGLRYRNLPLIDLIAHPAADRERLVDRYRRFVHGGAASIVQVLEAVADPGMQPVVFHCTAGKDRTGVIAALLLAVLGVSVEDIIADYSRARSQRDWLLDFLTRRGVQAPRLHALSAELLDCDPATMHEFLGILDAEYGGVRAYLRSAGANSALFASLETSLLERDMS